MVKRNFKVRMVEDGKEYWISPSVVAVSVVFINDYDNRVRYVLANKRGSGAGECKHMWSLASGFLEFNEEVKDCAVRELYEETGLKLNKNQLDFIEYIDLPDKGQVSFRFLANLDMRTTDLTGLGPDSKSRGGEDGEVEDVELIPLLDIDKYEWAFNHKNIIKSYEDFH